MERRRIGIVIPALNESETISEVVRAAALYGLPIVVDDGSTDGTSVLAQQAGAHVTIHGINRGYDAALNSGFAEAENLGCEIIITLDADGQHDPHLLRRFISRIEDGFDLVIGIRSRRQRFAEHLFSWYTKLRYGIDDPLCGMKAYRSFIYRIIGHFDSYGSIGTELCLHAMKRKYRICQEPFLVRERNGKPRFGQRAHANYSILRSMIMSLYKIK